jgi:hypothetical protein
MKTKILFIVLTLLLASCGKKVTVKGRIYNPVTNLGIEGVEVIIGREKIGVPFSTDGSGGKDLEQTTSDAEGYYSAQFRQKRSRAYYLGFKFDHEKYFNITSENKDVSDGGKTIDLQLVPYGKLAKNIKNINCFDSNDQFVVTLKNENLQNYDLGGMQSYDGCYEHSGKANNVPMGLYVYTGYVFKNGVTTTFRDSIYVYEGGNQIWNIEY